MHRRLDGRAGPRTPRPRGLTTLVVIAAMIVALLGLALPSGAEGLTGSVDDDAATTSTTADATTDTTTPTTDTTVAPSSIFGDESTTPASDATAPPTTDGTTVAAAATAAPTMAAALAVPAAASIVVTPASGLVQGDVVTITGSGFPANTQLAFVQCIPGTGPENCNLNNLVYVTSNASGAFTRTFTPSRILRIAGVNHDCAVAGECRIGGGTLPDGSAASATAEIQFDPSIPPPPPPSLTVTPSTNLLDRQTVSVVGTDYDAGSYIGVVECLAAPTTQVNAGCDFATLQFVEADSSGSFTVDITVRRVLHDGATRVDCAVPGSCVMTAGVNGPADLAAVPITFDGSIPLPPPPSLVVTPSTDLLDGQSVHVTGTNFDPNQQIGLTQCVTATVLGQNCGFNSIEFVVTDAGGNLDTQLVLDRLLYLGPDTTDCAQPATCVVQALSLNEGYVAAEAAIQFDPSVPLPPPPSITIDPATGVVDGQLITVTGRNFPRHNSTNVLQCRTGADAQQGCDFSTIGYALVNPDGTFTFALRVKRFIDVEGGRVDCAVVGACIIGAGSPPLGNPSANTPILFTANPPSTQPANPVEVAPAFTG